MDMTEIKRALDETFGPIKDAQQKSEKEIREELGKLLERLNKQDVNLIDLGQKLAGLSESGRKAHHADTIGEVFVKSEAFKAMTSGGNASRARVTLEGDQLKAVAPIYGTIDPNQFPVAPQREDGIRPPAMRKTFVRDALPNAPTTSNMIEYVQEKSHQLAPQVVSEGALKPQSDMSFELVQAPVVTIAHWILVSRQVLDDAAQLQAYINMRMTYGLKVKTDDEILNGTGVSGHFAGLTTLATPFVPAAGSIGLDNIRVAMANLETLDYDPNLLIMSPTDWATLQLTKTPDGIYLFGTPMTPASPNIWGLPVISSNAMTAGQFLLGDRNQAMVWDRQQTTVEVSREDVDNFRRNMVTILVEERLALSVFAPQAWEYGPLAGGVVGALSAEKSKATK